MMNNLVEIVGEFFELTLDLFYTKDLFICPVSVWEINKETKKYHNTTKKWVFQKKKDLITGKDVYRHFHKGYYFIEDESEMKPVVNFIKVADRFPFTTVKGIKNFEREVNSGKREEIVIPKDNRMKIMDIVEAHDDDYVIKFPNKKKEEASLRQMQQDIHEFKFYAKAEIYQRPGEIDYSNGIKRTYEKRKKAS